MRFTRRGGEKLSTTSRWTARVAQAADDLRAPVPGHRSRCERRDHLAHPATPSSGLRLHCAALANGCAGRYSRPGACPSRRCRAGLDRQRDSPEGFPRLVMTQTRDTPAHDKILIVDFGSQVTQLIARRVREEGVYSEVVPFQKAAEAFREMRPTGVILSGGPESVTTDASPRLPQDVFDSGTPVFGICYGQQIMAAQLGGEVEGGHHAEFGRAEVEIRTESPLFKG